MVFIALGFPDLSFLNLSKYPDPVTLLTLTLALTLLALTLTLLTLTMLTLTL